MKPFLYKPDEYEAKLIILFALQNLKKSPKYQVLSEVVSQSVDVQYFELEQYLKSVIEIGSVEEFIIDEEFVYSLTKLGEETCEYFSSRIPASVREKIINASREINNDTSDLNKVYADYIPINELEYKVVCGIMENGVKLLDFEMYAGEKEKAKKICRYFKADTRGFYMNIVDNIEKNI